jgi:uncharacterized ferredoxin-like protein
MKFLLSFLLVGFISVLSIGQSKTLSAFTSIATSGSVSVELIKGSAPKAEYTILKGNEEDLFIEVKNGELSVKIKSKNKKWNNSGTKASVKIYYQSLTKIDCSAGSSISAYSEIDATSMEIEASSGSSCQIKINTKDLKVDASSGTSVTVSGTSKVAGYDASSGAKINAAANESEIVDADVSSGASISAHATKSITADASSGGSIKYKGNPERKNINAGMSGSVNTF